jgi:hypothetical protein
MPVSAKPNTPEQAQLPIPQGFCIRMSVPVYEDGVVLDLQGLSVELIPLVFDIYFSEDLNTDVYEVVGWFFTDEAQEITSFGMGLDDFGSVFVDALRGVFDVYGSGSLEVLPPSACSFPAYSDNAALAQTFLVPDTGYDVYQIFNGQGILSFRVSQDDLANAEAGDVLGSNEAGNITFVYKGNGQCTVTYPYPDGKTNSKTFTCQGKITDWGRIPLEPNFFIIPLVSE